MEPLVPRGQKLGFNCHELCKKWGIIIYVSPQDLHPCHRVLFYVFTSLDIRCYCFFVSILFTNCAKEHLNMLTIGYEDFTVQAQKASFPTFNSADFNLL